MGVIIDTNVLVVANQHHENASIHCVERCMDALAEAHGDQVFLDEGQRILDEYRHHCSHSGQPGVGDAFFKWLWDNQGNTCHCKKVLITPHEGRGFGEFPEDANFDGFDRNDRKFVAVAVASNEEPPIINASDTDWWDYREAFKKNGINICFLCEELMGR